MWRWMAGFLMFWESIAAEAQGSDVYGPEYNYEAIARGLIFVCVLLSIWTIAALVNKAVERKNFDWFFDPLYAFFFILLFWSSLLGGAAIIVLLILLLLWSADPRKGK